MTEKDIASIITYKDDEKVFVNRDKFFVLVLCNTHEQILKGCGSNGGSEMCKHGPTCGVMFITILVKLIYLKTTNNKFKIVNSYGCKFTHFSDEISNAEKKARTISDSPFMTTEMCNLFVDNTILIHRKLTTSGFINPTFGGFFLFLKSGELDRYILYESGDFGGKKRKKNRLPTYAEFSKNNDDEESDDTIVDPDI